MRKNGGVEKPPAALSQLTGHLGQGQAESLLQDGIACPQGREFSDRGMQPGTEKYRQSDKQNNDRGGHDSPAPGGMKIRKGRLVHEKAQERPRTGNKHRDEHETQPS